MNKLTLLALLLGISSLAFTQNTALDAVMPYDQHFIPGTNMAYQPGWANYDLALLAAGQPGTAIKGVGSKTVRLGMFQSVNEFWGDHIYDDELDFYAGLGMDEFTALIDGPPDEFRDWTSYCPNGPSSLWSNLYEPIWVNGSVNPNNYYAQYLYNMVSRYGDRIRFWEIMNEPGFDYTFYYGYQPPGVPGNWWDNDPDPCSYKLKAPIERYVRILRISWEVIKHYDPDGFVLVSGVGFPSFLDAILRNTDNPTDGSATTEYPHGGGAYFDAVGFHNYPLIDGSTTINGQVIRNSDTAADGIWRKLNEFRAVMQNRGFNGVTYPEKHWLITEINVPHRSAQGQTFTGDEGARNYIIKAYLESVRAGIKQFHLFSLSDLRPFNDPHTDNEFMGLYPYLPEASGRDVQPWDEGVALRTTSQLLENANYDAAQSALMNMPNHIDGGAFKHSDGSFTYVLWAVAMQDISENASATYSFPGGLSQNQWQARRWDFTNTGSTETLAGNNISLTAAPVFLKGDFIAQTPCLLAVDLGNKQCDNRNTPTVELDDTYSFPLTITKAGGGSWHTTLDGVDYTGTSGVPTLISELPIYGGSIGFTVIDDNDPTCTVRVANTGMLPCSFNNTYINGCSPTAANGSNDIQKFTFGSLFDADEGSSGYVDKTSDDRLQARILNGATYGVSFQASQNRTHYWKLWIDYNQDGSFDASEIAFERASFGDQLLEGTVTFQDPLQLGFMRMRLGRGNQADFLACGGNAAYFVDYMLQSSNDAKGDCRVEATLIDTVCTNNDQFTATIVAGGWSTGHAYTTTINGQNYSTDYGHYMTIENLTNTVTVTITDETEAACQTTIELTQPDDCQTVPTCQISGEVIEYLPCDDKGTTTTLDDTHIIRILVNSTGPCGSGYDFGNLANGQYGQVLEREVLTSFEAYILVRDLDDPSVTTAVRVDSKPPCSPISPPNNTCPGNKMKSGGIFDTPDPFYQGVVAVPNGRDNTALQVCSGGSWATYAVNPGDPYKFFTTVLSENNGTGFARIKFLSSTWQPFDETFFPINAGNSGQQVSHTGTIPAQAKYIEIALWQESGGCVYVDDMCFTTEPDDNLCNVDFIVAQVGPCQDANTVNPSDDYYQLTYNINASASCGQLSIPEWNITNATTGVMTTDVLVTQQVVTITADGNTDFTFGLPVVSPCSVIVPTTCTGNLLTDNGQFNNSSNPFVNGEIGVPNGQSSSALRVCDGVSYATYPALPGQAFSFSGNTYADQNGQGLVRIKFLTAAWQPFGDEYFGTATGQFMTSGSVPNDAAYIEIALIHQSGGCVYMDDVCLTNGGVSNDCTITFEVTAQGICQDAGTTDPIDDFYSLSYTTSGSSVCGALSIPVWSVTPATSGTLNVLTSQSTIDILAENGHQATFALPTVASCSGSGPIEPCTPHADFPWHDWIAKVSANGIDLPNAGKTSYTNATDTEIMAAPGQEVTLELTVGFSYFSYQEYWKVWVDWNLNGAFEASELVLQATQASVPDGSSMSSIVGSFLTSPAVLGQSYPMRIMMSRTGDYDACTDLAFGEIEDYTLSFVTQNIVYRRALELHPATSLQVSVHPNPTAGMFRVFRPEGLMEQDTPVYLTDKSGAILKQWLLTKQSSEWLDINDAPDGIYQLIILGKNRSISTRIVKIGA